MTDQRQAYLNVVRSRLAGIDEERERLRARADEARQRAREGARDLLEDLDRALDEAREVVADLPDTPAGQWARAYEQAEGLVGRVQEQLAAARDALGLQGLGEGLGGPSAGQHEPERRTGPQHVVPHNGRWALKREGRDHVLLTTPTKKEALAEAQQRARDDGESRVVIHRADGTIQEHRTYG